MDAGELKSLGDLGITSLSVNATASGQTINGNLVASTASFTMTGADGSPVSRTMAEVDFLTSSMQTAYTPPAGFAYAQAALVLPQLDGYDFMPDLRVAMSLRPELLADVKGLIASAGDLC